MTLRPDQVILNGKYIIRSLLGEGGMARVWLAEELTFGGRQVALKEPRGGLLPEDTGEIRRRFQQEIRLAAQMMNAQVPNIVPAWTVELHEGAALLVMAYMGGGSIADLLETHSGGLPVKRATQIAQDLLQALAALHDLPGEPVHRDVKPSNVLLDEAGRAHLADFGLAQLAGVSGRSRLVGSSHPATPMYAAPEQLRSPDPLMPAADLFALGCVLFEMLTGKRYKRVRPGTAASSLRAEAPGWLDDALAKALEEEPWDRWQSAGEMAAALQAGLRGELEARQRARREAHERAQQETLAKLYDAAQAALRQKRWPEAIQTCDGIVAMDAGYRDVAELRAQAEAGLRAEQEAEERKRQRQGELGRLYKAARQSLKAQDWNAALRRGEEIERLEPGYRDVTQIRAQAQAGLREQREEKERERRRRAKVAALYQEAQRLLGRRKHQAALDKMAALRRLEPTHADPQKVEGRAREGLAKGAEPRPFPWAPVLGVLLVVAVIAGTVWGVPGCSGQPTPVPTDTPAGAEPAAGATPVWEKDGSVMVYVPAGEFTMGSPDGEGSSDEHPQHTVYLDGFWIDRTEVTNERYGRCVAAGACQASGYADDDRFNNADQPVVGMSWHDAQSYCEWAGKQLPTEAEWEKAARGTDGRLYPWGNEWDAGNCNIRGGGKRSTTAVGAYSPAGDSPYGCADMAGNVWEWVADWYDSDYYSESSATRNPTGPDSGYGRVLRGGSWDYGDLSARSAYRTWSYPDNRSSHYIGFRCCVSPTSSL